MAKKIKNLRIRFYGVQGSGSTFPGANEIADIQAVTDCQLLEAVFKDIAHLLGGRKLTEQELESYIGGPINRKTLLLFREKFAISQPRIYGGWTTCIHIETAQGNDIVFDCGSGFRNCAKNLQDKWGDKPKRSLYIFGSHSHYDHTEGFDQAVICFDPRNVINIYGNYQFLYALNSHLGIFTHYIREDILGVQTPINYTIMPAQFNGFEICKMEDESPGQTMRTDIGCKLVDIHEPIRIGETRITPINVCHPAPCLAYKVEHGGKSFIYCTDHELKHGLEENDPEFRASLEAEERLIYQARGADVMYRDGQFLRSEYDGLAGIGSSGPVPRLNWGHSCIEDVQNMSAKCNIKQTYIGHHDPNREWAERNWIDESLARSCQSSQNKIELARAGTIIDL